MGRERVARQLGAVDDEKGEKARAPRLVVAAAYPEGAPVRVGAEVSLDTGEIGFAAESQIDVNRSVTTRANG